MTQTINNPHTIKWAKYFDEIIKSNELCNKWYELGNVKLSAIATRPVIIVDRIPSMDKHTKDKIIKFLKTKRLVYWDGYDCYTMTSADYIFS